jgi:hypothetical protein
MPITDYSKTVIYVIKCIDDTITEEYVGSTTNFRSRKSCHKSRCSKDYNFKIYEFIRANGGWDNWIMIQLEEYPCKNKREAECREEQIRQERKATLNSQRAFITAEQLAEHNQEYIKEHAVQIVEKKKEYYKKHKEHMRKKAKEYYEKNKEQEAERHKKYRKEHAKQIAEYNKEYYKEYYKKKKEQKLAEQENN